MREVLLTDRRRVGPRRRIHPPLWVMVPAFFLSLCSPAHAVTDDGRVFDVAVGYSFVHEIERFGLNYPAGWFLSGSWRIAKTVQVSGELSRTYKTDEYPTINVTTHGWVQTLAVGPRFSRTRGSVRPYGQLLTGRVDT